MKRILDYSLLITSVAVLGTACNSGTGNNKNNKTGLPPENPAIASLQEQIQQYPDSIRLYDKLIDQYTSARNFKAAVAWCDTLLKADPDKNFSYWFVKGDLQRQDFQFDAAMISYRTYLDRFPDDEQILLNLANTAAEAGSDESLALSDRLMKTSSSRETKGDVFFIRGVYYSRSRQYPKAIENFDQVIINRYTFWEAYIEKAIAYYDLEQFDKSLQTLNQLQQANQSYPDAYYWMGKCYEALNKKSDALKNYEAAYALDKNFIEAKEKLDSLGANPE